MITIKGKRIMSNEKTKKAGSVFVDLNLDFSTMKRALKNLSAAIEATEKGLDYIPRDNSLVNPHEGERVLTKAETKRFRDRKA